MDGPGIVVRTISAARDNVDAYGNRWQYNSRSDHHSKVACWAILFDLLQASALFRLHVAAGRVVFGVNQEMSDFKTRRKKDLDLVIARPGTVDPEAKAPLSFAELRERWTIVLDAAQQARLKKLPALYGGAVGSVLVALEAKACMTAHSKSRPRLYDELNSSHLTVHGASDQAIAVGFVMLNNATEFVSPGLNKHDLSIHPPVVNRHRQPAATMAVNEKIRELPTRTKTSEEGYDALGIVVVDCVNDGTPVTLVTKPPAPPPSDLYHYDQMVRRAAQIYDTRFAGI
jgi:hypothetical protein